MKFFRWIFSVSQRHRRGIRRYEKGGAGVRIFTLILMLILAGAALALEWWSISLFEENILVGVLAFVLLACTFCLGTIEFSFVYATVAFRMFFWGVAQRAAYRAAKQRSQAASSGTNAAQTSPADTTETESLSADSTVQEAPKTHRAFDMFLFLFGLILGIGIIVAFIACFVVWA